MNSFYFVKAYSHSRNLFARFIVTGLFSICEQRVLEHLGDDWKIEGMRFLGHTNNDLFEEVS
jgi:hypothetical protein